MTVEPYVFFEGRCDEAIEFYKKAIHAEVQMIMRYKESPMPAEHIPPGGGDKIMHASLMIGGARLLVSDGHCSNQPVFQGFGLALSAHNVDEGRQLFSALSDGGRALMPFGKTFFSEGYGRVVDRFGVMWMVLVGH